MPYSILKKISIIRIHRTDFIYLESLRFQKKTSKSKFKNFVSFLVFKF